MFREEERANEWDIELTHRRKRKEERERDVSHGTEKTVMLREKEI